MHMYPSVLSTVAIELREGSLAVIEDTTIYDSELQAILSHEGARGFTLKRCVKVHVYKFVVEIQLRRA